MGILKAMFLERQGKYQTRDLSSGLWDIICATCAFISAFTKMCQHIMNYFIA